MLSRVLITSCILAGVMLASGCQHMTPAQRAAQQQYFMQGAMMLHQNSQLRPSITCQPLAGTVSCF